jgi:methyl-accepting chemotaxis protein
VTVGKQIGAGYAVALILQALVGFFTYYTTTGLLEASHLTAHTHLVLEALESEVSQLKDAETGQRGFIITGREEYLEPYRTGSERAGRVVKEIRELTLDNPSQQQRLNSLEPLIATKLGELAQTIQLRRQDGGFEAALKVVLTNTGKQSMDDIRTVVTSMESEERRLLDLRTAAANASAQQLTGIIMGGFSVALVLSLLIALLITRTLNRQVGSAVQHILSSSAELQAAASQQASGMKEQGSSMAEITTTIRELLATSRQIAESAQRVVRIAEDTGSAARGGDQVVQKAHEAIAAIKRQVDTVVTHMLELGKRSQQIGSVLEIVNELLEQTNILAINATIEASSAGDSGKRFAAVADEIRKLSDRVGVSAKEIRALVEEVRASVNSTVMATEGGSKAVDAGTKQFSEVTSSFKQIAGQVGTTTDAAREIELSTKQQASAVEQVNSAISNVSQAGKETEASAVQTLQTASELTELSRELARLVQPHTSARA